jgi:2-polyprenyl-6-hydroxyphenyl methylase/3-demethylubiquinone-9 3-methyltransferase
VSNHAVEVAHGDRFTFGANWGAFLGSIDERRITTAESSVRDLLETSSLAGLRLADIGCGSGLFSLAARRLGATVHSLDYDPQSVACARKLKAQYFATDAQWTIEEGSALDAEYLRGLGHYDVVYSWGVLHHTGAMWTGIELAAERVAPGGVLAVALYNDQGWKSKAWWRIKNLYCSGPLGCGLVSATLLPYMALRAVLTSIRLHGNPVTYFTEYKTQRGMSVYHDWKDWFGGYPYEVAKPEDVLRFLRGRGFTLINLISEPGHGCNQFVFRREC